MKKSIIWLVASGLMVVSLVLASCAPKVTEEKKVVTEEKKVVTEEKKVVTEEKKVVAKEEVPRYEGVLNLLNLADPTGFSRSALYRTGVPSGTMRITNEQLLQRDRLKGPGGSGEWDGLQTSVYPPVDQLTGLLAESFEIIQPDTLKFKIRRGIRWQDKAPTYGMELTAEDVVYTFIARYTRTGSGSPTRFAFLSNLKNPKESVYLDPDDPRTVVFKVMPERLAEFWEYAANFMYIEPKALGPIEGEGFATWKDVVGTGPFLLTDYVTGSSITYQRNPNYWQKDQLHPQNQLPYIDGLKIFIIPDLSTQYAAMRTGKLDIIMGDSAGILAEDAESLMRSSPQLKWAEVWGDADTLFMRHDVKPFDDVRVRRAMQMAIDHDEMVKDYYGGKATKFYYPGLPIAEHRLWYQGLWEEMPESVKELYTYNPEKAKKLLDEAGLPGPNRFTTSITISSAWEEKIDLLQVVAAYWAKVGVTLKIDIKEPAVFSATRTARTYPHGVGGSRISPAEFPKYIFTKVGSSMNYAEVNDPLIEATLLRLNAAYFDWAEVQRIQREVTVELQNRVLHIHLPLPITYIMWQPWLGGYHGENEASYLSRVESVAHYVWIDQELKKKMTGRR